MEAVLHHQHRDLLYNLGNAKMREEFYVEALDLYTSVLELDPIFDFAYYNRGLCRIRLDDSGGLDDLINASKLDCKFVPLYEALVRYGLSLRGFEFIGQIVIDEKTPTFAQSHLRQELKAKLQESEVCMWLPGIDGHELEDARLLIFCLITDAIISVGPMRTEVEQVQLLCRALSGAQQTGDSEVEWRVWYLLGAMAYWPIASMKFPPHLPIDIPNVFLPLAWSCPETHNALSKIPGITVAKSLKQNELDCMAAVAHACFEHAISILCTNSQSDWELCEDVFRELARCCVFLSSASKLFSAIESARFCYQTFRDRENGRRFSKRISQSFSAISTEDFQHSLASNTLVLNYFVGEIVEDRILISATSCTYSTSIEGQICAGESENRPSVLGRLMEANEHWMPRFARVAELEKAKAAYKNGYAEPLLGILMKANYKDIPNHIGPRLEEVLLGSLRDSIKEYQRLVILPYNYLHNFPFHALPAIEVALREGNLRSIVYAPSGRLLLGGPNKTQLVDRQTCLFVGYDEKNTLAIAREKEVVESTFSKCEQLIGKDANRDNVLGLLPHFDTVHFCCHGSFDLETESPCLVLSDSKLLPDDILSLDCVPSLVFANACISATGYRHSRNGDQSIGLHTAFLLAGARGVIGTLWKVHDDVAVEFSNNFYLRWNSENITPLSEIFTASQRYIREHYDDVGMWATHAFFGGLNS